MIYVVNGHICCTKKCVTEYFLKNIWISRSGKLFVWSDKIWHVLWSERRLMDGGGGAYHWVGIIRYGGVNAMQCNPIQYHCIVSMQYNAMQCNFMQSNTIRCVLSDMARQCNTMQYHWVGSIRYGSVNAMQCDTI